MHDETLPNQLYVSLKYKILSAFNFRSPVHFSVHQLFKCFGSETASKICVVEAFITKR